MLNLISTQEMLVRLAAATVLGGLIGAERERVESTVGLRTHAIVALGSATGSRNRALMHRFFCGVLFACASALVAKPAMAAPLTPWRGVLNGRGALAATSL